MTKTYLLLLCSLPISAIGQSYYYVYDQGVTDEYDPLGGQGTIILNDPFDDGFSANQTVPFTLEFFGFNVGPYKVTDNGYLTFDLGPAPSSNANTAIPDVATPNYSIYALWDNLELSSNPPFVTNWVRNYTVGTTPNRVHVIQWHATQKGLLANSAGVRFAIRLFEQGDFDIVLQHRGPQANLSATVGCEDLFGTDGTMVTGSPNFTFTSPTTYNKEDVTVYKFIYGTQPSLDASMNRIYVTDVAHAGSGYDIGGRVINHGTQTITSLMIEYQVNSGPVQSTVLSGLNIAPNETYDFTHPTQWTPANPGNFQDVTLRVTEVNGSPDGNPQNNESTRSVWVNLGTTATKNVLIEQFATAGCGQCPDGYRYLAQILDSLPNVVALTHHRAGGQPGQTSDGMTIPMSASIASAFGAQGSTGSIDRMRWPGEGNVAITGSNWLDRTVEALDLPAPVDISISPSWNASTREITTSVSLDFVDYIVPGDLRLHVFVIEDKVTGTGNDYNQKNIFDQVIGHPYEGKGDPIFGFVHRQVIRASMTGTWGDATGIPQSPGPNDDLQISALTYTLPASYKQQDVSLIAFLTDGDTSNQQVLNAKEASLGAPPAGTSAFTRPALKVFPNPMTTACTIKLPTDDFTMVKVYDMTGSLVKEIPAAGSEVNFSREALAGGMYLIEAVSPDQVLRTRLVVQ